MDKEDLSVSGLGFLGSALPVGVAIAPAALACRVARSNRVMLLWIAFVLSRPFGATYGDLLTRPLDHGGLDEVPARAHRANVTPVVPRSRQPTFTTRPIA